MKDKKYGFTLQRARTSAEYEHLYLAIYEKSEWSSEEDYYRRRLSIKWQRNVSGHGLDGSGWYGATVDNYMDVAEVIKVAAILKDLGIKEQWGGYDINDMIKTISKKAEYVIHDARADECYLPENVKGPEYRKWYDDYEKNGMTCARCSVWARSESEAKGLIAAKWATSNSYMENFKTWVATDMPVAENDRGAVPVVKTIEEMLE